MESYLRLFYNDRVDLQSLADDEYHLVKCTSCGALFQPQVLTGEGMRVLYEDWVDPQESRRKAQANLNLNPLHFADLITRLASLVDKRPEDTWFLDFGCGWGDLLQTARTMGYNAVGVEISPTMLTHMKSRGVA